MSNITKTAEKILCQVVDQEPSGYDDETQYEIGIGNSEDANIYELIELFDQNQKSFKFTWYIYIDEVKKYSTEKRTRLCLGIYDKIINMFDFQFNIKMSLKEDVEIDYFIEFIEFIRCSDSSFIRQVWDAYTKEDVDSFRSGNHEKIDNLIHVIENINISSRNNYSYFIREFLNTCSKDGILTLLILLTEEHYFDIIIEKMS